MPRRKHSSAVNLGRSNASSEKDFLDLCILLGDLEATKDRAAAESFYDIVLAQQHPGDAERSEIFARAFYSRGTNRASRGRKQSAIEDFKSAAAISRAIADHVRAARAEWAVAKLSGDVPTEMVEALERESPQVRVAAITLYDLDTAAGSANILSRRRELSDAYIEKLLSRARERVAIEDPKN